MKAKVSISHSSDGFIRIRIRDESSRIEFAEIALTPEHFGNAVTGLSEQDGELEVRGLEWVGKTVVTENREIECPLSSYNRGELEEWLRENGQEEGWLLGTYLGSQSSVGWKGDKTILRYSVTKYV